MILRARLFPRGEEARIVLEDRLGPGPREVTSGRYAVDVDDPALEASLRDGDDAGGFQVSAEAVLTRREVDDLTHLQLASAKTVPETAADFRANDAVRAATPWVEAGGPEPVKLMRGLTLSRIGLRPGQVGTVGDWTSEFVVGDAVAEAFRAAALTGFTLDPIMDARGRPHPHGRHLRCEELLPPAVLDASVETVRSAEPEEDGRLRHLGNLCYAPGALRERPDFARSAEPWDGWHGWPSWVVTKRVRALCVERKVRGWRFRPVFVHGSGAYAAYLEGWTRLRALVESTTRSSLDGARW